MGACCSSASTFRFKNFVVAVYPADYEGEPNRDALGKLESYVTSNPERIPRVCRKISKLVSYDVNKGNIKRVGIGVQILRDLIDNANELQTYVPYVASICLALLENGIVEYRIGAADLLSALCSRIAERSQLSPTAAEQARRLVADSKDTLAMLLKDMAVEGVGTNDIISLHCRYAAIVALGNLATCIQSSMSDVVTDTVSAVLSNLQHMMKDSTPSAEMASTRVNVRRRQRSENVSASTALFGDAADYKPTKTVVLPVEASEKDVAFLRSCLSAVASLSLCCSSAGVPAYLATIANFCNTFHGWTLPKFAPLVYRAVVYAFQKRPQPVGINVCLHLCELAEENAGTQRYPSILRSLAVCIPLISMTGGRPQPMLEVLKSSISSGLIFRPLVVPSGGSPPTEAERSALVEQSCSGLKELCRVLVASVSAQGNTAQLSRIVTELSSLIAKQTQKPLLGLLLELLAVVAPYAGDLPAVAVDDLSNPLNGSTSPGTSALVASGTSGQKSLSIFSAIFPYLNAADELQSAASRVLATLIAQDTNSSFGIASTSHELLSVIDDAKIWIGKTIASTDLTPQYIVAVTNVLTSIVYRLRWDAAAYALAWIAFIQRSHGCVTAADPSHSSDAHPFTALQQSWLHASAVVLRVVGDFLFLPKLSTYAQDVLQRRRDAQPSELGVWFQPTFRNCTSTTSGLAALDGERDSALASRTVPPVTNYLTLGTVVVYLTQTAEDIKRVSTALGVSVSLVTDASQNTAALVAAIESHSAEVERPTRQAPAPLVTSPGQQAANTAAGKIGASSALRIPSSQSFSNLLCSNSSGLMLNSPSTLTSRAAMKPSCVDIKSCLLPPNAALLHSKKEPKTAADKLASALSSAREGCGGSSPFSFGNAEPLPIPLRRSGGAISHKQTKCSLSDTVLSKNSSMVSNALASSVVQHHIDPSGGGVLNSSIVLSTAKALRLQRSDAINVIATDAPLLMSTSGSAQLAGVLGMTWSREAVLKHLEL